MPNINVVELKISRYMIKTQISCRCHPRCHLIATMLMRKLSPRSILYFCCNSNRYDDIKTSLFQIFKTYGDKTRKQAKEHTLYYDYHPFNSTEPILLALMIKDQETEKTI